MNEQSGRSNQLEVYEPSFVWFIIGYIFCPIISVFYYLYKYITFKPTFFIKTSTIIKKRDRTIVEEDWEEVLIDRDLNTWEIERIKSARNKLVCILIFYVIQIIVLVTAGIMGK